MPRFGPTPEHCQLARDGADPTSEPSVVSFNGFLPYTKPQRLGTSGETSDPEGLMKEGDLKAHMSCLVGGWDRPSPACRDPESSIQGKNLSLELVPPSTV